MFAWITALASRARAWLLRHHTHQEFERELETHLEMLTDENVRRDMPPEEAKRAARIRLGGHTQLKETNRELHSLPILETFLQDTRYAFRMLRKNPGFTGVVILTLALGIGANTAIFTMTHGLMLHALPVRDPGQLVEILHHERGDPEPGFNGWSLDVYRIMRGGNHVFSDLIP